MKLLILVLLAIILFLLTVGQRRRVPGETTQKEQSTIRGFSLANDVSQ